MESWLDVRDRCSNLIFTRFNVLFELDHELPFEHGVLQVERLDTFEQRALRLLQLVVVFLKSLKLHPVCFHMLTYLHFLQLFRLSFILFKLLVELRTKVLCELDLFILLPHMLFLQESYFGRDALFNVPELLVVFELGLQEFLSELCK